MPRLVWMICVVCLILSQVVSAQEASSLTLAPMQTALNRLDAATPIQDWFYGAEMPTTILVETVSGTLDPAVELLNINGDILVSNDDFAPAFSPAARLTVPAGVNYTLRVKAVYGEGEYRITSVVGEMHRQWDDDFPLSNPYWTLPNVTPLETSLQMQTPLTTTRLFTPLTAPELAEFYLQARFTWGETRTDTEAGLVVRGKEETNGQISGWRLEVSPTGNWFLRSNDGIGTETTVAEGQLLVSTAPLTLGLLAQGDQIWAVADGSLLAQAQDTQFQDRTTWGITIYDGQIFLDDFWLATPAVTPPHYPAQLATWESSESNDITAELVSAGVLPAGGERVLVVPNTRYTVNGQEQRNFLVTEEAITYDNVVIGGDIRVETGADIGCGLVGRFNGRNDKVFAYADTQLGAGLLWWTQGALVTNNYSSVLNPNPTQNRMVLILQDQFATLYLNGDLTAQNLVPLRAGNVGVGFVNYAAGAATCIFDDIWIWE